MNIQELDALMASAQRPESTVQLCLRGDLQAQWEALNDELAALRGSESRTLSGSPAETEAARRVAEVEDQMKSATIEMRLRAIARRDFQALTAKHGPRKDNQTDRVLGVNQSTFFDALIGACLVEPTIDQDRLTKLLDSITDAQFQKLADAAWMLNRRDADVPFSPSGSPTTESSVEK